jgi:chromosome partitioning protein
LSGLIYQIEFSLIRDFGPLIYGNLPSLHQHRFRGKCLATVFAVVNQKGGVGKTTTVVNVAAYLAQAGKSVLLVDMDPQGNATSGLGIDKRSLGLRSGHGAPSLYDVLINEVPLAEAIQATPIDRLSIAPSHIDLAGAEPELAGRMARETVLKQSIAGVREEYDFILVDAPPSLGLLTVNVLVCADTTLVPIQCEYYALEGVSQLTRTIDLVRRSLNPALTLGLIVLTMYDNRVRSAQQVVEEVRKAFGSKVAKTIVPRNVRLSEAPSHGVPVALYDPRSRGALAYKAITEEILKRAKEGSW